MLCFAAGMLFGVSDAQAIELMDGKLVLHGKISEQFLWRPESLQPWEDENLNTYRLFHARTTLKLEAMAHLYDGPKYELNFYTILKNFYDAAHHIDPDYERNVRKMSGSRGIEQLKSYEKPRDIIREAYLELNHPSFQVRLGKQIVSWGETSVARMTDIINPVDLRGNLNPAYPDFDEIKRGLWMARFLFTPFNWPMNLMFEAVVIPDYEPNYVWPQGYHLSHGKAAQSLRAPNEATLGWYRDTPTNEWTHPEVGFRIRGFLWGFDWTLLYFYHRGDQPVVKTGHFMSSQLAPALGRRLEHDYKFAWQHSIGFTFNKTVDRKITLIPFTNCRMTGNVLRGEFLAELGKDHVDVTLGGPQGIAHRSDHNRYAFALGWDTKIYLPYITPRLRNKLLSSSTQLFMEWVPNRHRMEIIYPWYAPPTPTYRQKGHHWCMITQSVNYELWHGRILPGFYWSHAVTEGSGYYAPVIGFKPTFRWTFMLRYLNYYGYPGEYVNHLDQLTFEITYEF